MLRWRWWKAQILSYFYLAPPIHATYYIYLTYFQSKIYFILPFNQFDNWSYWLFCLIHFSLPKETNNLENWMDCKSYIKARDQTNMSQIYYTFFVILVFLVLSWSCIVKLNACKHGYKVRTATLELLLEVIVLLKGTRWVAQNLWSTQTWPRVIW